MNIDLVCYKCSFALLLSQFYLAECLKLFFLGVKEKVGIFFLPVGKEAWNILIHVLGPNLDEAGSQDCIFL